MDRLIETIEWFRRENHDECEDCFYSCPSHPSYCGTNEYCNCYLAENNARVDEALKIVEEMKT